MHEEMHLQIHFANTTLGETTPKNSCFPDATERARKSEKVKTEAPTFHYLSIKGLHSGCINSVVWPNRLPKFIPF